MKNFLVLLVIGILGCAGMAKAEEESGWGARFGAHWGYGKMYNRTKTIPVRTMNTVDVQALPGYRWAGFLLGPWLEARLMGQNTEPSEVAGQNTKGKGYLLGVAASYRLEDWNFLGAFKILGKHSLSKQDASGRDSVYKSPLGFELSAGRRVYGNFFVDLALSLVSYRKNTLGGVDADIADNRLTHWNAGLGLSYLWP